MNTPIRIACGTFLLALFLTPASRLAAEQPPAAKESPYHRQVRQLLPVAWWSFGKHRADLGEAEGAIEFATAGPTRDSFRSFGDVNDAAVFSAKGGKAGVIRLEDIGPGSQFDFDNGDPITIEAWVNPQGEFREGSTMYVLGKGRTNNRGQQPHNQNYGFRILRAGKSMRLSFLFRSHESEGHKSDWHRWDSSEGFGIDTGWHHVAVTYVFGDPESIRGYVDGERVKGAWNPQYAGATTHPPIVDDDDIWVGSSMGRSPNSSFRGGLDEVALYRRALTSSQLSQRYPIEPYQPKFEEGDLGTDFVRVEVVEDLEKSGSWPRRFAEPTFTYQEDAFGFFQIPEKYVGAGVRGAWTNPYLLRAATKLVIPKGRHEWLLRIRGKGRLWLDDKVIAEIDYGHFGGGGHNQVKESSVVEGTDLRYLGPGDREKLIELDGDGKAHVIVFEMMAGNGSVRATLGETSLSFRQPDGGFALLSPAGRHVPLTDEGWLSYRRERMAHLAAVNQTQRLALRASEDEYWDARHEAAREHLASAQPIHSSIDSHLEASWQRARELASQAVGGVDYATQIKPIFAEHCFRCHDKKSKGGLRLSSRTAALLGGESETPAIVPGDPDGSELLARIDPEFGDMPPQGDPLSRQQRSLIARWISEGASYSEASAEIHPTDSTDDLEFLRRVTLDTVGVVPTLNEIDDYLSDDPAERRTRAIDRLLNDPRWADHWTAYWQDVLAENPNILKPSLNNSGPFRYWIHEALEDNLPMDRFVTELLMMKGDAKAGGPAGFALAAQNDVPMAAKAHIVGTAFLGVEMKCARCHDAPYHDSKQRDLFELAAMLRRDPIKLPESSSVPATTFEGREPLIEITLKPGATIKPAWPGPFAESFLPEADATLLRNETDSRERLALLVTSPANNRFPQVVVNRLWKQFLGVGLVDPVDDWEASEPSHPNLLSFLARELVLSGYDQKHVARLILNSDAYQRKTAETGGSTEHFASPGIRRMTAEQVVDSMFGVADIALESEELTMDNDGTQRAAAMISLGHPRRAWEFTSLSNERDRPSLAMPKAQAITDVLENFGWRASRQEPKSTREVSPNMRQPAILANGSLGVWITTLSEDHGITELACNRDLTLDQLIERVFLTVLTRRPNGDELTLYRELLGDGFADRWIPPDQRPPQSKQEPLKHVSWSNHLSEEANRIKLELEKRAREGKPPTVALDPGWRERLEDMLWALVNSPEFVYVP